MSGPAAVVSAVVGALLAVVSAFGLVQAVGAGGPGDVQPVNQPLVDYGTR